MNATPGSRPGGGRSEKSIRMWGRRKAEITPSGEGMKKESSLRTLYGRSRKVADSHDATERPVASQDAQDAAWRCDATQDAHNAKLRRDATQDAQDARGRHDASQDAQDAGDAKNEARASGRSAHASDAGLIFADVLQMMIV